MRRSTLCILALSVGSVAYGLSGKKPNSFVQNSFVQRRDVSLTELFHIYLDKVDQDTSRGKRVTLPEAAIIGVRGIQEIGLTNLQQQAGYQGTTLDKMAVYIPHPATSAAYMVEAVTLRLRRVLSSEEKFEQGELKIRLCEAIDVDHPPGANLLSQELIIAPHPKHKFQEGKQEIMLATPIELPAAGLYVVAEWHYERTGDDVTNRKIRSATLAANLSMPKSYTWTSVGDFKQTWQREGEAKSLSQFIPYYKGKIYNALMGVKVKECE